MVNQDNEKSISASIVSKTIEWWKCHSHLLNEKNPEYQSSKGCHCKGTIQIQQKNNSKTIKVIYNKKPREITKTGSSSYCYGRFQILCPINDKHRVVLITKHLYKWYLKLLPGFNGHQNMDYLPSHFQLKM